jgi:hypothetical protein
MGVVQNRTFSKGKRLEIGMFGGSLSTDPFLSVQFRLNSLLILIVKPIYWVGIFVQTHVHPQF